MRKPIALALALTCLHGSILFAGTPMRSPVAVEAVDTHSDAGGSITVTWARYLAQPDATSYVVSVATSADGPFHPGAEIGLLGMLMFDEPETFGRGDETQVRHFAHITSYTEEGAEGPTKIESDTDYFFKVGIASGEQIFYGDQVVQAAATGNWFNKKKLNNFVTGTIFSIIVLVSIAMARRRDLFIRRIAGLEALDEALGRATEMGRSVLFIHGLAGMDHISTIASINVLSKVAQRTAEYDSDLRVTNQDPVVMSVSQEVVKEAYLEAGRPDAYNPDHVFMVATDQFSYAAAVAGIMVRDKPAAHILMGYFYAESLLLAETGATTGAIQIAGTDSYTQLPFFVTTCDYTLMGEELYAASAYLAREPRLLGSLKGQDIGKAALIAVIVVGTILATLDVPFLTDLFTAN